MVNFKKTNKKDVILRLHVKITCKNYIFTKTPVYRAVTYNRTHGNALTHSCNTKIKHLLEKTLRLSHGATCNS